MVSTVYSPPKNACASQHISKTSPSNASQTWPSNSITPKAFLAALGLDRYVSVSERLKDSSSYAPSSMSPDLEQIQTGAALIEL